MKTVFLTPKYLTTLLLSSFVLVTHQDGLAFEVHVVDRGPSSLPQIDIQKVKKSYPLATPKDVVCGKPHHMARLQPNGNYIGLSFSILAKKETLVKIHWDHPEHLLFPKEDKRKVVTFSQAGGVSRLYFRALQAISGNIYISNEQGTIIQTCPYSILPPKYYRQSISLNVNETQYDYNNGLANNTSNHYSVNYRINPINTVPSGGNWSINTGISQSESSTNSQRITGSVSYNW